MRITVKVPATSANLGCGFDVFGLALALYSEFTFDTELTGEPNLEVQGEGAGILEAEGCGLVLRAAQTYAEMQDVKLPAFRLKVYNRIPLGRGLGSSAAAIVGGLVGAAALVKATEWETERDLLLRLATEIEGHPDNVAPALLGGLLVAVGRPASAAKPIGPLVVSLPIPSNLQAVLFVPEFEMSTKAARAVLPQTVPFADAVHNMARTGLFAAIFATSQPPLELLGEAMADRLHQPYRTQLFPQLPTLIETARRAGAYGAALSGAGSSVLALVDTNQAAPVSAALTQTADHLQLTGYSLQLEIASSGTQATILPD